MSTTEKEHIINIPAFISEITEVDENGAIFACSEETLIDNAKASFAHYNAQNRQPIISDKRSKKAVRLGIGSIVVHDLYFNTDHALLLKVSSFKTNLVDGYYQRPKENSPSTDEYKFRLNDRLGSDTYFFVLYPVVKRNIGEFKCQEYWYIFLYVDPSKEVGDMKTIARYIMSVLIKRPIKHIKAQKFIEELRKHQIIQSVEISFYSYTELEEDERPGYLNKYAISCKETRHKVITLTGMNVNDAIEAYEDTSFKQNYNKRQIKFINSNNQVYQATQEYYNKLKETFEDSFNYTIVVTEEEVRSGAIFNLDFIKEKVEGLITRYTIQ